MDWALVTGPGTEPITRTEAKLHAKVDATADDDLIDALIVAARQAAEEYLSRGLYTQTWKAQLAEFYDEIPLPRSAPLQSVTWIKYYDGDNTQQTLSSSVYTVDLVPEPGRVLLAPDQVWPTVKERKDAIEIRYVVGWNDTALIPQAIKQGMLLLIGNWHRNRESVNVGNITSVMPMGVESLWAPHRVFARPASN
jgi:uncharacterized phiE125 gp8 family phage protein